MRKIHKHQTKLINNIIIIVVTLFIIILSVLLVFHNELALRFNFVVEYLTYLENAISQLDSEVAVFFSVLALFIAKTQIMIPLPFICIISGMVYNTRTAFLINIAALIIEMTIKYVEGSVIGGGWAEKIINIKRSNKTRFIKRVIEFNGTGNPYVLFCCRLVPFAPLNTISRIYGSMKADYINYICISIVGMLPRVYTYTRIGHAVFNPFSVEFIMLIMILVMFVGISALICNIFYGNRINQINQISLFVVDKQKYKITFEEILE